VTAGPLEDEKDLLARLRAGDEDAFVGLVTDLAPALLRLAALHVPSRAVAEEIVQDTWLAVISGVDKFEGRSTLRTWIFRILLNRARSTGVREHRTLPFSSAWRDEHSAAVPPERFHSRRSPGLAGSWSAPPVPWDEQPEDRLSASEVRQCIEAAVAELPIRQREVVTARDLLGLEAGEVCALLELSGGNQRVLLHRGRSQVRAALERHFGGDAA
jgi:RNA polymerase sigma-70 factor, ECF subfamily